VAGGGVTVFHAEILDFETADGSGHPAVLVAMIVNAAVLADFPADGHTFKQIIFENKIPRVAALGEEEIFVEGFGADVVLQDEILDVFEGEVFGGNGGEVFDPVRDVDLGGGEVVRHGRPPREYSSGEWPLAK
jgi:hypothetical protein